MQMMGDDIEVNVMEPKSSMVTGDILQMQTSASPRINKSNTTPSLQTQLILSTVKYSFMLCISSVVSKCLSEYGMFMGKMRCYRHLQAV